MVLITYIIKYLYNILRKNVPFYEVSISNIKINVHMFFNILYSTLGNPIYLIIRTHYLSSLLFTVLNSLHTDTISHMKNYIQSICLSDQIVCFKHVHKSLFRISTLFFFFVLISCEKCFDFQTWKSHILIVWRSPNFK